MTLGPYREPVDVPADDAAELHVVVERDEEEIGPVVVRLARTASVATSASPPVVRLMATCAALAVLVMFGMLVFRGQ